MLDSSQDRPQDQEQSVFSMRPDEHKKKQRADYKKKHGISNKKTASKEKHEATKTSNASETQEGDDLGNTSKVRSQFAVEFSKMYKEA